MPVTVLVLITLASNLLSILNSPTIKYAYEKFQSFQKAIGDLDELKTTIKTIQAVLADAEKKQEGSAVVRNWIERVTDVLYDADDLFDEVAISTNDLLEQQNEGSKLQQIGKLFSSKSNQIVSRNSIANKVKAIRKRFLRISEDMEGFRFVECHNYGNEPICDMRKGQDQGSFIDPDDVYGRDQDKKTVLEMIFDESNATEKVSPIAIVGIGGIGKTTLAQLVYNDDDVEKRFEKRWFACISDTSDDREVLGKIFQSIHQQSYRDYTVSQLQTEIRKAVVGVQNFLLVLDDVWDDDHDRWINRMKLLSNGTKGSKIIIVTTRSSSVVRAVDAVQTHNLDGLSNDDSWALFKRVAFSPKQVNDPRWLDLGKEIMKKCANVPLAIRSIGSLLYRKDTIQEWESFNNGELSRLKDQSGDSIIMNTLKLSYDHLPSNVKHCFAYCSLFPKDFEFERNKLIYLWIAQGYIKPSHETVEQVGHSYFMDLLRMSFFQQVTHYPHGEVASCKMHDLVHDLAQFVAGEEIIMTNRVRSCDVSNKSARHVSVGWNTENSWETLASRLNINRLRSFVLMIGNSHFLLALDQQLTNFNSLRALSLQNLRIETVPSSIGELKHLRYLDLPHNGFKSLPDSMMNLLLLITLNIEGCYNLEVLPDNFRNLVNLRYLNLVGCDRLKHMPHGIGKLSSLEYLSTFKVGKVLKRAKRSELDALAVLELRGMLMIQFDRDVVDEWEGDESWQLPVSPHRLYILMYPGMRIPPWANGTTNDPSFLPNLAHLQLGHCLKVKYLPPFRCLPYLKSLILDGMLELEYVEDEEEVAESNAFYFRCLENLEMRELPKLKGWSRKEEATSTSFPLLSQLIIEDCPELKSIPLSPCICKVELSNVDGEVIQQLLSAQTNAEMISVSNSSGLTSLSSLALASLQHLRIDHCHQLKVLHLAAPHLRTVLINECDGIRSFRVTALTSLWSIKIYYCKRLRILHIAHPNVVEEMDISGCSKLKLWEKENTGVCWNSLPSLRKLTVDKLKTTQRLPSRLRHLQALGKLQIIIREICLGSDSDDASSSSIPSTWSDQEA